MSQFVLERIARSIVSKVAAFFAPANDGVHNAGNQLAHRSFTLWTAGLAVKIFAGDNISRRLRPISWNFHIVLAENCGALFITDQGSAPFPFDRVEWRNLSVGEEAAKYQSTRRRDIFGCSRFH